MDPGRTAADNRPFLEAVLWIARTGSPWHDLPEQSGRWNSISAFCPLAQKGRLAEDFRDIGSGC
ncbi:MAG: transposase [Zoogloeaceae bacterium]|jgi:transposase|nr:transposase [Zoogloeaceae bacterium]